MQAAAAAAAATATACFTTSLPMRSSKAPVMPTSSPKPRRTLAVKPIRAVPADAPESSTIDYSSSSVSVFPMEACDVLGGDACKTEMFPEVKLEASETSSSSKVAPEEIERDYLEYNDPKTVFPGEACDDLGGEFCEAEYQDGVY